MFISKVGGNTDPNFLLFLYPAWGGAYPPPALYFSVYVKSSDFPNPRETNP